MSDVLAALDPEQRQAAEAVSGPVCILAGAGTGKTRAITHRVAHMVLTGAAPPDQILAVTFTTRAAGEMRGRLRGLGVGSGRVSGAGIGAVQARTFHSAALRQLQYFWPRIAGGGRPSLIESKLPSVRAAAARTRVAVDAAAQRDLASEIEWAKAALVDPERYAEAAGAAGRQPPFDLATVQRVFATYEAVNGERGQLDFEDLLLLTAAAIEEHDEIAREVRSRYRFFVVDEYQDVSPLQQRLLDAWLGDRDELCVVGDPNQTIYSFTGASPAYLLGFPDRYPSCTVVRLVRDYRSTEQVVGLANQLLPSSRLVAQQGEGPPVSFAEYPDEPAEAAAVVATVQALSAQGTPLSEMAVLFRVNAQSEVYEAALADAGVPYLVRGGERFFDRPEVRQAVVLLRGAARAAPDETEGSLPEVVTEILRAAGLTPEPPASRGAAREKWDALRAVVGLAEELVAEHGDADLAAFVAELGQRADTQHAPAVEGVTLASLHAAKGLEWDAVFLVGLVDGTLPITHAFDSAAAIEEERRLLYVGATRARRHLSMSWALARAAGGRRSRKPSRFLDGIRPSSSRAVSPAAKKAATQVAAEDVELFERLREWRRGVAAETGMPPYIVFSDRTLAAIASVRPSSPSELASISGVGPKKLEEYAVAVLDVVRTG